MARRGKYSFEKRQKELLRQKRKQEKAERRAQRREERTGGPEEVEDPDLAGIVPGPQPSPWDAVAPAPEPGADEGEPED